MCDKEIDVKARLYDAIEMQRARLWAFKVQKDPEARQWNDAVRVMGLLLKEARSLIKDGIEWSRALGAEEKRAVIVGWFASLPPNQQRLLLEELAKNTTVRAV